MAGTLTIVARSLEFLGAGVVDDDTFDEKDVPITDFLTKLRARPDKTNHVLLRAKSVEQVRTCLNTFKTQVGGAAPDRLQIVGHGRAGALLLAATWFEPKQPAPAGATYTLDSDPDGYGVLLGQIAAPTVVHLLGCNVGDPGDPGDPDKLLFPDGPTLLFDLARVWNVPVCGPPMTITAADLDDEGIFKGANERLCKAEKLTVTVPSMTMPNVPPNVPPKQSEMIHFLNVVAAPCLSHLGMLDPDENHQAMAALTGLSQEYIPYETRPLLAAPEIRFLIKHAETAKHGDVIAGGRLLRVREAQALNDPTPAYFIVPPSARRHLQAVLRKLLPT